MPAGTPRTSAAALSAAVDSTDPQGNAPNSQAEPSKQKHTPQTPAALRERGVWGERRFSLRSGLSPQNLLLPSTSIQPPLYDADDLRKKITDNRKISAGKPLKDKNKDCTKDRETDRHAQPTR